MLAGLGYSLNTLSMFGLVLAIGIVVDDAIVVVENVERNLEHGMTPREAAHRSMDEVSTALVAIVLVLCAVFVPVTFLTGITGEFYRQFAVTIAASTIISLLLSLTLSPALAARLLKPKNDHRAEGGIMGIVHRLGDRFNAGFARVSEWYSNFTRRILRAPKRALAIYTGLVALTVGVFVYTPAGFIPAQDQGYALAAIQLPPGSSIERTDAVLKKAVEKIRKVPGVDEAVMFSGFDGASGTQASNAGAAYVTFKPFEERAGTDRTEQNIENDMRAALADMDEAFAFVIPPPVIQGIGNGGGYRMIVQDRSDKGYQALEQAAGQLIGAAHQDPTLANVFTLYNTATPRIWADIDRAKADMLGVPPERVFEALQVYLGSAYVNDFNLLGRTYRVTAQADAAYRDDPSDIALLKTRSNSGAMVPIGSVATFEDKTGPYRVTRYNLFPAVEVDGETAPGTSTGQAMGTMEKLAAQLPAGFATEWTGIAFQQEAAGNIAILIFALSVVFVFLVLAAQFESLLLPLAIILIVPMTLARGDDGREPARDGQQHPDPDRPDRAHRARREECDPDRRVRQAGGGAGARADRGGGRSGACAASPDPDDQLRLHPRHAAAGDRERPGLGAAPGARHRGLLRDDRRHGLRPDLHAGLLRGHPHARRKAEAPRRGQPQMGSSTLLPAE